MLRLSPKSCDLTSLPVRGKNEWTRVNLQISNPNIARDAFVIQKAFPEIPEIFFLWIFFCIPFIFLCCWSAESKASMKADQRFGNWEQHGFQYYFRVVDIILACRTWLLFAIFLGIETCISRGGLLYGVSLISTRSALKGKSYANLQIMFLAFKLPSWRSQRGENAIVQ